MESSLDAKNSEGQFKVTRGHQRLNGLPLLYEHDILWAESLWKSGQGHQGSPEVKWLTWLCEHETWWMESSLDAKMEFELN